MASSLLMVDRPPFVDLHSLLNRVTLSVRLDDELAPLSWPSCDVEVALEKEESFVSPDITGGLKNLQH